MALILASRFVFQLTIFRRTRWKKNSVDDFINFVTGQTSTSKHLAGKHDQDRHGIRAGAGATPEQLAARKRVAGNRAEEKKPAVDVDKPSFLGRGGQDAKNLQYSKQSMRVIQRLENKSQLTDRDKKADWQHATGEWGQALEKLNDIKEAISGERWPETGWDRKKSAPEAMRVAKTNLAKRLKVIKQYIKKNPTSDYAYGNLEILKGIEETLKNL